MQRFKCYQNNLFLYNVQSTHYILKKPVAAYVHNLAFVSASHLPHPFNPFHPSQLNTQPHPTPCSSVTSQAHDGRDGAGVCWSRTPCSHGAPPVTEETSLTCDSSVSRCHEQSQVFGQPIAQGPTPRVPHTLPLKQANPVPTPG